MYENETAAVRLGIEFLTALSEKDYLTDPSFDPIDLENKLNEIEGDINYLISNLPVEVIDDDEQREEEYRLTKLNSSRRFLCEDLSVIKRTSSSLERVLS